MAYAQAGVDSHDLILPLLPNGSSSLGWATGMAVLAPIGLLVLIVFIVLLLLVWVLTMISASMLFTPFLLLGIPLPSRRHRYGLCSSDPNVSAFGKAEPPVCHCLSNLTAWTICFGVPTGMAPASYETPHSASIYTTSPQMVLGFGRATPSALHHRMICTMVFDVPRVCVAYGESCHSCPTGGISWLRLHPSLVSASNRLHPHLVVGVLHRVCILTPVLASIDGASSTGEFTRQIEMVLADITGLGVYLTPADFVGRDHHRLGILHPLAYNRFDLPDLREHRLPGLVEPTDLRGCWQCPHRYGTSDFEGVLVPQGIPFTMRVLPPFRPPFNRAGHSPPACFTRTSFACE